MYDQSNPFLNGNYAPWREEGFAPALEVEGEIPRDIDGTLYRIGPNPAFAPLGMYHWFDGDGMVHAFRINNGRASYRNRWVKTDGLQREMEAGKALFGGLLNPKAAEQGFKNAANTNIIGYARKMLALWEGGLPHELIPDTLDTVGLYSFGGKLNGPMTAHPKFDPKTGEMLFFGYQPFPPYVVYHRADRDGNLIESRPIDTGLPVMMHDFVVTDRHVIFFVCPSVFHLENMANGKPVMQWEPEHGTKIGVMARDSGEIKWFKLDPFYVFHFLNAYEEGSRVIVDACRIATLDMTGNNFGAPPLPHRFTFDMTSGAAKAEQISDNSEEFPRIDDRRAGLKHRFGYTAAGRPGQTRGLGFGMLTKRDYQSGRVESQDMGARFNPGEPIFVARRGATDEDDGYVLAVWFDEQRNSSEVTVIDARNFGGKPLARIKLSHRVPFGFHGNWVDARA